MSLCIAQMYSISLGPPLVTNLIQSPLDNINVTKINNMLEKLNQLAEELFQTLNFNTCNCEQQEIILQEFVSRGYYLVSAH